MGKVPGKASQSKAPVASTPPATAHKLIVAVDYGTTYSGVSYVTTDKKEIADVNIITTWPGELSTAYKTPTRIAYAGDTIKNANLSTNKWGFEVESKHQSYSWTKLLLDRSAPIARFDDPSLQHSSTAGMMQLPAHRDAQGVCEDYLKEVYKYVFEKLKRQMGAATFDRTPMECWITLPAIWSDQAKASTLAAAKSAGFGSRVDDEVYTIAEPEAAAIATLKQFSEVNTVNAVKVGSPHPMKELSLAKQKQPGEHILLCDCGGGTVDLTAYTISSVEPQLTFNELCVGIGGKCGSTSIDRNLHALLSSRFGEHFREVSDAQKGPGSRFMLAFEKIKRSFGTSDDRGVREIFPLKMNAPNSQHYDEEERTVKLSFEDMKRLFDPVVNDIVKLVGQQVMTARRTKFAQIDRIILVGGFGDSAYLNQRLAKWCVENGRIHLMCPENPQAAVIRGAAIRGLEQISPNARQARRHYGFGCGMIFRPNIDPEDHSYYNEISGREYCSDRVKWTISKGETIVRNSHSSHDLTGIHYPGSSKSFNIGLYSSTLDSPPDMMSSPDVQYVGRIVVVLPADFDYGPALQANFNERLLTTVYSVTAQVQVVFGNKGDNLTFRTIVNGKVHGCTDIEFGTATA